VNLETSNLVLQVDCSKSQPTDDKLSLKRAWSCYITDLSWLVTGTKYAGLHTQWLGYPVAT